MCDWICKNHINAKSHCTHYCTIFWNLPIYDCHKKGLNNKSKHCKVFTNKRGVCFSRMFKEPQTNCLFTLRGSSDLQHVFFQYLILALLGSMFAGPAFCTNLAFWLKSTINNESTVVSKLLQVKRLNVCYRRMHVSIGTKSVIVECQ